jgi:hypothetical protein
MAIKVLTRIDSFQAQKMNPMEPVLELRKDQSQIPGLFSLIEHNHQKNVKRNKNQNKTI